MNNGHRDAVRVCPGCKKKKSFPARNKTCSYTCGYKYREEQRGKGERKKEPVDHATAVQEHALKMECRELRARLNEALSKQVLNQRYQDFVADVASRPITVPEWVTTPATGEKHVVIPTISFSDWHFDEQVFPAQIQNANGYNREIAERRLKNYFNNTVAVSFQFLSGFRYPGIIWPWLGDIFSGNIHEELRNTNADVMLSSLLHWTGPIVAGARQLADAFGKVYIPVVVGNHGRNSIKPIHKMRVRDNFDWLFAQVVARELADDKRITFAISEAPDMTYSAYNTTYHITHGDQARGGTGIAAQWSPLMLLAVRKLKRVRFDYLVCGHWHRLGSFLKIRANGSGVGYNEYAFNNNFDWEPPQQDFWLTDPQRGIVCDFPIHVMSKDEPWVAQKPEGEPFRVLANQRRK